MLWKQIIISLLHFILWFGKGRHFRILEEKKSYSFWDYWKLKQKERNNRLSAKLERDSLFCQTPIMFIVSQPLMQERNPRLKGKVQRHLCMFLKWAWIKLAAELCLLIMCVTVSGFCLAQGIHVIASYLIFSAVSGSFFFLPSCLGYFLCVQGWHWGTVIWQKAHQYCGVCFFFFFL